MKTVRNIIIVMCLMLKYACYSQAPLDPNAYTLLQKSMWVNTDDPTYMVSFTESSMQMFSEGEIKHVLKYYLSDQSCENYVFDGSKVGKPSYGKNLITTESCYELEWVDDTSLEWLIIIPNVSHEVFKKSTDLTLLNNYLISNEFLAKVNSGYGRYMTANQGIGMSHLEFKTIYEFMYKALYQALISSDKFNELLPDSKRTKITYQGDRYYEKVVNGVAKVVKTQVLTSWSSVSTEVAKEIGVIKATNPVKAIEWHCFSGVNSAVITEAKKLVASNNLVWGKDFTIINYY